MPMMPENEPETVVADSAEAAAKPAPANGSTTGDVADEASRWPEFSWPTEGGHGSSKSFRPRIALVGPKGSGKTLYRLYLSRADMAVPTRLARALRCDYLPWNRDLKPFELQAVRGEQRQIRVARDIDEWRIEHHPWRGSAWRFFPKIKATTNTIIHSVPLPRENGLAGDDAIWVMDFAGEHWLRHRRDSSDWDWQRTYDHDRHLLRECKVVLLMVPFWLLIPAGARAWPAFLPNEEREGSAHRVKWLLDTFEEWYKIIAELLQGRSVNLVIALTMFGRDWHAWFDSKLDKRYNDLKESFAEVRALLRDPVLNGRLEPGWFRSQLDIYRFRALTARIHVACRDLVRTSLAVDSDSLESTGIGIRLHEMAESAGAARARYIAMNLVSERDRLVRSFSGGQEYKLREELAGVYLPNVYLSSFLDELRDSAV